MNFRIFSVCALQAWCKHIICSPRRTCYIFTYWGQKRKRTKMFNLLLNFVISALLQLSRLVRTISIVYLLKPIRQIINCLNNLVAFLSADALVSQVNSLTSCLHLRVENSYTDDHNKLTKVASFLVCVPMQKVNILLSNVEFSALLHEILLRNACR